MTQFVASNGFHVHLPDGDDAFGVNGMFMNEKERQALREFFQHERDIELGRWRSKEHPSYVVYPQDEENYGVLVVDEISGVGDYVSVNMAAGSGEARMHVKVAREFFAAHPEPKPWHNAQPGEVWALTVSGKESAWAFADDVSVWAEASTGRTLAAAPKSPAITAGRRIWPEVSE